MKNLRYRIRLTNLDDGNKFMMMESYSSKKAAVEFANKMNASGCAIAEVIDTKKEER